MHLLTLWHVHQPDYRAAGPSGAPVFSQPWAYLHATKDYSDMAAHLERHPSVAATFNFSSTLLEQLEAYTEQFAKGVPNDPLLQALSRAEPGPRDEAQRRYLGDQCFRIKRETMVRRFAPYAALEARTGAAFEGDDAAFGKLPPAYFDDLVTWYHLAWCGEALHREDPVVRRLVAKGERFSLEDRLALFEVVRHTVSGVLPRYRALADRAQIELSLSPHAHPIAPLLIDFSVASQITPGVTLPTAERYPGGLERVQWHIDRARAVFRRCFGREAEGTWPPEAAVSEAVVDQLGDNGFRWLACDEMTVRRSLGDADEPLNTAFWHWGEPKNPAIITRSKAVSEFLSFEYSRYAPQDAAVHLLDGVRAVAARHASVGAPPLVMISLDGENAWEHYDANAWDFFEAWYTALDEASDIQTATPSAWLAAPSTPAPSRLPTLLPGTWIGGDFSMWIGDPARNRGWDALVQLKHAFDAALPRLDAAQREQASVALGRCEGSDWLWWMGFDEPREAVLTFDRAYKRGLAEAYEAIGTAAPPTEADFSRVGHAITAPVSTLELATAMARAMGMQITVEVPEGTLQWGDQPTSPAIDEFLERQEAAGWLFHVPAIDVGGAQAAFFKYAEIRIALEKSNVRFFEGRALLSTKGIEPGILVVGVDRAVAQRLVDRFRMGVALFAERGQASSLMSFVR